MEETETASERLLAISNIAEARLEEGQTPDMLMKRMNKWMKKIQRTYRQRNEEIMSMTLEPRAGEAEGCSCGANPRGTFERAQQPAKKTWGCKDPADWLEEDPTDWLDCQTWRLTPEEAAKQTEIRKSMRSRAARQWAYKRIDCKRPLRQNIVTKWIRTEHKGVAEPYDTYMAIPGYDYHLETTTEHIPCRQHIIQGMKPEKIVELQPQETIQELLRKEKEEEGKPMLSAGGASIVIIGTLGAKNPEKNEFNTIRHQHWKPDENRWKEGSLPHDWVKVDWTVDRKTHMDCKVTDPTGLGIIRPTKYYNSVVDTGTQVTCIGRKHAEELGVDINKLSQVDVSIGSISGEKLSPLGSCFVNITGTREGSKGKTKVITKDVAYVFEGTPHPYLSRSVLAALGIVKDNMEIGDHPDAGGEISSDLYRA